MIPEANTLIAEFGPMVNEIAQLIYDRLVGDLGCAPYVKTIYIGFEHGGEMVAALYPRAGAVEVALALPEAAESPLLIDATHLTWRTMPVAAILTSRDEAERAVPLLEEALNRVAQGTHDVNRAPEHFIGRVKRGNSRPRSTP